MSRKTEIALAIVFVLSTGGLVRVQGREDKMEPPDTDRTGGQRAAPRQSPEQSELQPNRDADREKGPPNEQKGKGL